MLQQSGLNTAVQKAEHHFVLIELTSFIKVTNY